MSKKSKKSKDKHAVATRIVPYKKRIALWAPSTGNWLEAAAESVEKVGHGVVILHRLAKLGAKACEKDDTPKGQDALRDWKEVLSMAETILDQTNKASRDVDGGRTMLGVMVRGGFVAPKYETKGNRI